MRLKYTATKRFGIYLKMSLFFKINNFSLSKTIWNWIKENLCSHLLYNGIRNYLKCLWIIYVSTHRPFFSANIKPVFKGIVVLANTLQLYQPVWDLLEMLYSFFSKNKSQPMWGSEKTSKQFHNLLIDRYFTDPARKIVVLHEHDKE